jgi:hypothetical protein
MDNTYGPIKKIFKDYGFKLTGIEKARGYSNYTIFAIHEKTGTEVTHVKCLTEERKGYYDELIESFRI